jgi:type IV pilus assembly protein PilM
MSIEEDGCVRDRPVPAPMPLKLSKQKTGGVVGLDIEAGSVAAAEVEVNGSARVTAGAIEPLAPGAFGDGEVVDGDGIAEALKSLFSKHKLSKRVRLGIGNQRVVVRTMRLPAIEDPKELDAAIRFQAQEQIPMPLDQAVLEHQVVGGAPGEDGTQPQLDVVVVAARRDMVVSFLDPIRRAGLQPVGVDLSAFGMIRALAGVEVESPAPELGSAQPSQTAVLYCSLGDVTNLAVARGRACLFTRVSDVGLETIADRLASARGLLLEHAHQWLAHVGLERPLAEVEGDPEIVAEARRTLEEGVSALVDELRLSLDYYGALEGAQRVERVVLCGPGNAVHGLAERMESGLGLPIASPRPPALAGFDESSAARLTLPFGLALDR